MVSDSAMENNKSRLYHPKLPDHWRRCSLYSMAEWVNGLAFRSVQFSSNGMPVIKIAEIKGGISGQTKFTQQTFDEAVRIRPGDLLFSWSGQPETSIDTFWWRGPQGWLNQHIFRVSPVDGIDRVFFYHLLKYLRPNFVRIAQNKQTTGLGHVTRRDLESIEAGYPPLPEQRAIAHILGTLDDKIELNRRMNETLEAMAQAIFKSWFVDFDPVVVNALRAGNPIPEKFAAKAAHYRDNPHALGLPDHILRLFPDRFQDSELGPIPEGWGVKTFGDLLELAYGKALKKADRRPGPIPVYGSNGQVGWHDEPLVSGPGIVIGRKGNPGIVTWVPTDFFPIDTTFYVVPKTKSINLYFLFYALSSHDLPSLAADSAVPGLNRNFVYGNTQLLPSSEVLVEFEGKVRFLFETGYGGEVESRTLATLRDTLLPKLISGELRVPDAERVLEAVG